MGAANMLHFFTGESGVFRVRFFGRPSGCTYLVRSDFVVKWRIRRSIHSFQFYCVGLELTASSGHYLLCLSNFPNVCVAASCSKNNLHATNGHTMDNGSVLKKLGEEGLGNLGLAEHAGLDDFEGRAGT